MKLVGYVYPISKKIIGCYQISEITKNNRSRIAKFYCNLVFNNLIYIIYSFQNI